ncbi:MAG: hypothetical protein KUG77_05710 [Nannocystaceae bacterium]|nr:hypothetical protein [Nannocystaceae bacterium]
MNTRILTGLLSLPLFLGPLACDDAKSDKKDDAKSDKKDDAKSDKKDDAKSDKKDDAKSDKPAEQPDAKDGAEKKDEGGW